LDAAECYTALLDAAECYTALLDAAECYTALLDAAVCLHCVAKCGSMLYCVIRCGSILYYVVRCGSMLHRVIKCGSMLYLSRYYTLHVAVRGLRIWPLNAAKCCENAGKFFPDVGSTRARREDVKAGLRSTRFLSDNCLINKLLARQAFVGTIVPTKAWHSYFFNLFLLSLLYKG